MNKKIAIASAVVGGIAVLGSVAPANAATGPGTSTRVFNSSSSNHNAYAYTGTGCTGTKVTLKPGYYANGALRSAKASYSYKVSINGGPSVNIRANTCTRFTATSVNIYVS